MLIVTGIQDCFYCCHSFHSCAYHCQHDIRDQYDGCDAYDGIRIVVHILLISIFVSASVGISIVMISVA